jgi:hypothetical protein
MYKPIPPEQIRSRVVAEKTFPIAAGELDVRQRTKIAWSDLLPGQRNGAIFLTVEGEPLPDVGGKRSAAQALIQLTDIGILWKHTAGDLRVSLFSLAGGQPMANARATLLDGEQKCCTTASPAQTGSCLCRSPPSPGWLLVQHADDAHALRMGPESQELPVSAFRVPTQHRGWDAPCGPRRRRFARSSSPIVRCIARVKRCASKGLLRAPRSTACCRCEASCDPEAHRSTRRRGLGDQGGDGCPRRLRYRRAAPPLANGRHHLHLHVQRRKAVRGRAASMPPFKSPTISQMPSRSMCSCRRACIRRRRSAHR